MPDDTGPREVTVNQIVAWNMAYYRRAARLTQEQLGRALGGWSVAAVSAAERSWDGPRTREFDAAEILAIARAIGVPHLALLLPPDDEPPGWAVRTVDAVLAPADYFAAIMPDLDDKTSVMDDYRNRLTMASVSYQEAGWGDAVKRMLRDMTTPEQRAARLDRIRHQMEALRSLLPDLGEISDLIAAEDEQP